MNYVEKTKAELINEINSLQLQLSQLNSEFKNTNNNKLFFLSQISSKQLLNIAAEIIIALDANGNIIILNESGHKLLGYNNTELIGKSWFDKCIPKSIRQNVKSVFYNLMSGDAENVKVYENPVVTKSGDQLTILWHNTLIKNAKGKIIGTLSSGIDITKSNKAREKLELQSEIINNLSDGVYLARVNDGTIVYTNPAFEKMFGCNNGELIGNHVSIIYAESGQGVNEKAKEIIEILNKKGEWRGEIISRKKDGTPFWCYVHTKEFNHSVFGKVWVTVHTNIDEQKILKDELIIKNRVFEASIAANAIANIDGIITHVNQAFLDVWGFDTLDEVVGKPIPYFLDSENDAERIITALDIAGSWEGEYVALRKDKTNFSAYGLASIITNEIGERIGYHSAVLDISDKKETEKSLQYQLEVEALVLEISSEFINLPMVKIDNGIINSIKKLAEHCNAEKGSLFTFSKDLKLVTNTHEWCKNPKDSQIRQLQGIPAESLGYNFKKLKKSENLILTKLEDLKTKSEKQWVKHYGFRPILFVPLILENRLYGTLGFYGAINEEKKWHEQFVSILKLISDVFVGTLERKEYEKELTKHREHLEQLVEERTKQLENKNFELERYNKLFIGREFRIKELKERIKKLESSLNEPVING